MCYNLFSHKLPPYGEGTNNEVMEELTMPMHMGFRWYGEGNDAIKLSDIKQIPGVTSIV